MKDVFISIVDKGALDCTIKARVECAVYRSAGQKTDVHGEVRFDNESK